MDVTLDVNLREPPLLLYAVRLIRVLTESRYQRRRRLLNNARWGKDGKWAKMADTLESVPVLGETALAPMTGFLRGAMGLYSLLPYQGIRCSSGLLSLLLHHHHPCRNFTPSRLSLLSALLLRSSSFVVLPPTFCVSRVLACYASVLGARISLDISPLLWIQNKKSIRKFRKINAVTSFSDDFRGHC